MRIDTQNGTGISADLKDDTAFLTIGSAECSHKGYYQCVAYNRAGTASSVTYLPVPQGDYLLSNKCY